MLSGTIRGAVMRLRPHCPLAPGVGNSSFLPASLAALVLVPLFFLWTNVSIVWAWL